MPGRVPKERCPGIVIPAGRLLIKATTEIDARDLPVWNERARMIFRASK
jgi:hypothetical protein